MSIGVLLSAWLVGALGGVHCIAMCGGLIGAVAARDANGVAPLRTAREIARRQFAYHAGRLTTYAVLGALFGAAGAATLGAVSLLPLQRAMYVAANVFVVLLGASLAFHATAMAPLQQAGLRAFAPVLRGLQPLLCRPGASGRVALGLAWGFMPCAMIGALGCVSRNCFHTAGCASAKAAFSTTLSGTSNSLNRRPTRTIPQSIPY